MDSASYLSHLRRELRAFEACLAGAVAYVNWFVIPVEEAALGKFGGYAHYRATVHRWL